MISNLKSVLIGRGTDEDEPSSALPYGLSLAQQAQAHATVLTLSCKLIVRQSVFDAVSGVLVSEENARRAAVARSASELANLDAASHGTLCAAQAIHLPLAETLSAFRLQARVHGLSILDAQPEMFSFQRSVIEEALFDSGRPAIVVPKGRDDFRLDHVMVAWDGSAPAARALNDALPFLAAAKTVNLVCVAEGGKSASLPGAEIAPHLARHGVDFSLLDLYPGPGGPIATLREQSHAHRTDLIVMGAFAHSWWRKIVLGGVTQSFLSDPPAPLFLSR